MSDFQTMRDREMNLIAMKLRTRGLSYTSISTVMDELYGYPYSAHHWRHRCRAMGAVPVPYGAPYGANRVAA